MFLEIDHITPWAMGGANRAKLAPVLPGPARPITSITRGSILETTVSKLLSSAPQRAAQPHAKGEWPSMALLASTAAPPSGAGRASPRQPASARVSPGDLTQ